jgi:hypothetical protein
VSTLSGSHPRGEVTLVSMVRWDKTTPVKKAMCPSLPTIVHRPV